ncbi:hypothetical protein Q9L58_005579 [Maublancomyces gigas]|uniref:HNH nuclease domain-containing protein n=1 Tax=Discina gigas TaxID=1032678 RepID=A0ABR3GHX0_9PEZI
MTWDTSSIPPLPGSSDTDDSKSFQCPYIFYDRILRLPDEQLKLMAKLFTAALTGARSWGGSTRSTRKSELDQDRIKGRGKATPRTLYQKRTCFERQFHSCAITGGESSLQHAHIIPHSIVSLSTSDSRTATLFWMALAIILGPSLRDTVFSIVGTAGNFYKTTNSIALVSSLHWGSPLDLAIMSTARPVNPDDQVRVKPNNTSCNAPPVIPTRAVNEGDRFRLFTNNPEKQPLPQPLLLGVRTMLWRMIATAGMAGTTLSKKRRHVDSVDGSSPKHAKRGSGRGKRRGTGGRYDGGGSARLQGASNDGPSLGGNDRDETQRNQQGASGAATEEGGDDVFEYN